MAFPDKTILVPLTNSLYVPGKLADPENVIVDVGTGYYVKKVCTDRVHASRLPHASSPGLDCRPVSRQPNITLRKWIT